MKFFVLDEVAVMFGKHRNTVRKWVRDGLLKGLKLGGRLVFTQEDLDAFLAKSRERLNCQSN